MSELDKKTGDYFIEIYEDFYPHQVYVYSYRNFTELVSQAFLSNSIDLDTNNNTLICNAIGWSRINMNKKVCNSYNQKYKNISVLKNIVSADHKFFGVESMIYLYSIEIKEDDIIKESKKNKSLITNILNNIQINFFNSKGKLIFRDYYFVIIDSNKINLLLPGANLSLETLKEVNTRLNTRENTTNKFLEDYDDDLVSNFEILLGHKNNSTKMKLPNFEFSIFDDTDIEYGFEKYEN